MRSQRSSKRSRNRLTPVASINHESAEPASTPATITQGDADAARLAKQDGAGVGKIGSVSGIIRRRRRIAQGETPSENRFNLRFFKVKARHHRNTPTRRHSLGAVDDAAGRWPRATRPWLLPPGCRCPATVERLERLKDAGVVRSVSAELDPVHAGYLVRAIVGITVQQFGKNAFLDKLRCAERSRVHLQQLYFSPAAARRKRIRSNWRLARSPGGTTFNQYRSSSYGAIRRRIAQRVCRADMKGESKWRR